ncbi:hypothetical protein HZS_5046 [Henneguya salminicola]|nr:hypothetical protein HZS_5046 [Henneguya salminicola]
MENCENITQACILYQKYQSPLMESTLDHFREKMSPIVTKFSSYISSNSLDNTPSTSTKCSPKKLYTLKKSVSFNDIKTSTEQKKIAGFNSHGTRIMQKKLTSSISSINSENRQISLYSIENREITFFKSNFMWKKFIETYSRNIFAFSQVSCPTNEDANSDIQFTYAFFGSPDTLKEFSVRLSEILMLIVANLI